MYEAVESGRVEALWSIWSAAEPVVVLGRSNRAAEWIDEEACRRDGIPLVRRCSGGGAVVLGPGCLNYAVCLSVVSRPALADVTASYGIVHDRLVAALAVPGLAAAAGSDLVWRGRKVSGSAQRRGRRAVLHHGTVLYAFDAELAHRYLREPPRQPAYRHGKPHRMFMGNLPLREAVVRTRVEGALIGFADSSPIHRAVSSHVHNGAHVPIRRSTCV